MRKQQAIWLQEHTDQAALPTMANVEPASGVVIFADWLREQGVRYEGRAIDIGCGKGRNSTYLASLGYEVWAVDYIEPALDRAKKLAEERGVNGDIHFLQAEIDSHWNFDDNYFDIAVDSFSSIDIETKGGRKTYRDEMYRTLKTGGYAMVMVVSADDEWEKEAIATHPGLEPNSAIWPKTGKYQKNYDESELREFYKSFEILDLRKVSKPAFKLNREGIATNFWLVLRKPELHR